MSRVARLAAAVLLTPALAGCAQSADAVASSSPDTAAATIHVFAPSSLTDVFADIASEYQRGMPGVTVELVLAGSSDLAAQINEGAPADVFASADQAQMDAVGGAVVHPEPFAANTLVMVVPQGNPLDITGVEDLARADVTWVLCAPQVPCGTATVNLASRAGLTLRPASEEANVSDVLGKVASGQADAGIVYATDIERADGVVGIELPGASSAVNVYSIGALGASAHPNAAASFVEYVLGAEGQAILAAHGFTPAP